MVRLLQNRCKIVANRGLKTYTMAKLFYYHDTRSGHDTFPLKIRISHNKGNAYLGLDIRIAPDQWDAGNASVVNHDSAKQYNARIRSEMIRAEGVIADLKLSGQLKMYSASELKAIIENDGELPDMVAKGGNFVKVFDYCIETKKKVNTRMSYEQSLKRMREYDNLLDTRAFEDIDLAYLQSFDRWLSDKGVVQNSRNVYYRNIRAVFNHAIDNDITTAYPFRKFKMRKQATRKRSLTIDELRTLKEYPCEEWQRKYVDIFFLMFYLIGINGADLFPARRDQVKKGRLEYERAKTYKRYSVKIEPEAQAIIDRYKGENLLLNICETRKEGYQHFLQRMSRALKTIGPYERKGRGGKKTHAPLFPDLTQYWCRYTWATIAAELDIPKETIAAALGHDMGNTTTAIYINFNQKKVDEANRRVIDFLNKK